MSWENIHYLRTGTERQRQTYYRLIELDIFSVLAEYDPILVGTVPLNIDTPSSDLDIVCCAADLEEFGEVMDAIYGEYSDFLIKNVIKNNRATLICRFSYQGMSVEIFAQSRPSEEQRAYRHLVAEANLLRVGGEGARAAIQHLKMEGVKTEPAFGHYFFLDGDPYMTLLDLADAPVEELMDVVRRAERSRYGLPTVSELNAFENDVPKNKVTEYSEEN